MKFLLFSALALLLLSVESVLVRSFGFEVTRIDVGLAIVVYVALCGTTVEGAFSAFAVGAKDRIAEIEINPVLAGPDGAVAVDCIALKKAAKNA